MDEIFCFIPSIPGRLYFLADRVVEITADMFKNPRKLGVNRRGQRVAWGGFFKFRGSLAIQLPTRQYIYMVQVYIYIFVIMYLLYNGQMNGTWIYVVYFSMF